MDFTSTPLYNWATIWEREEIQMAKKREGWSDTCDRYVAFLDIMGFKDKIFRESHEEVKNMFLSLIPTIKDIKAFSRKSFDSNCNIKPVIFSDSIILVSSNDSKLSFEWMVYDVQWILLNAFLKGIPIKGAIAFGEQTAVFKDSLYFGKPLIDAYDLQNELQLYGVVLHHTVEKPKKEFDIVEEIINCGVIKMPVTMKSDKIMHYILDWTYMIEDKKINPLELINSFYADVSGKPRIYVDNTLKFLSLLKNDKVKQKAK